jgi:hypothetical protein
LKTLFEYLEEYELLKVGSGISLGVNAGAETIFFEYYFPNGGELYKTLAFSARFKNGMVHELYFVKDFVRFNKDDGPNNLDRIKYN